MRETCGMHGRHVKCIHNLVRKPEGKRLLVIPRYRWEDNMKTEDIINRM
jgi:hypothetical protein